jgi:HlyD family secretion protein
MSSPANIHSPLPKPLLLGTLGVALAVVLIASLVSGPGATGGTPVDAERPARKTIVSRVKATGEITAATKVPISAKVGGEIVELPVHEGSMVKSGDLLAQIEQAQFQAARDSAQAQLAQSTVAIQRLELQVEVSKKNLDRSNELSQKGFGSAQDLEQAQIAYSTAQVELAAQKEQVNQARSMLDRARDDLSRTTIRSPIDGQVIELDSERGQSVVPGTTNLPGSVIMVIGDMSHLVAEVQVGEVDVVGLAAGQPARVVVDALGETKPQDGIVDEIATSGVKDATTGVVRFKVKVRLDHPDPALKPSMTARVSIQTVSRPDVLSVPIQAVVKRRVGDDGKELDPDADKIAWKAAEDRDVVYVTDGGKAKLVPVSTGTSDELRVEIASGLEGSETVVVGPYRTLKDLHAGDPVSAKAPAAEAEASPSPSPSPTAGPPA